MRLFPLSSSSLLLLPLLTHAERDLTNTLSSPVTNTTAITTNGIVTDPALCLPQGPGYYTFGMTTFLSTLGVPGGSGISSDVSNSAFLIMSNTCQLLGLYGPASCGIPFTIKDNFLQYVLTITAVDEGVASPYFSFLYANGKFSIRNDGCVCGGVSAAFPDAEAGCRCAFPVAGEELGKRGVAFEA
ncbi:hypothetical protein MMC20_004860 [Loxospora ochrophaea]|nr:hypothetical protein [Loxospora ochrophaea]